MAAGADQVVYADLQSQIRGNKLAAGADQITALTGVA